MLLPKKKRLKDYQFCFYGHEFKRANNLSRDEVYIALEEFLKSNNMEIAPFVESGKWLWSRLIERMHRSAFCVFETRSQNRNVHIELGYALANGLNVILVIPEENGDYQKHLPSDLSGLVQMRYENIEDLNLKLRTDIPKRYYSVEERLSINLQNIFPAEKIYFEVIIEVKKVKLSDLATRIRTKAMVAADNLSLADFIRKYDEILEIGEKDQLEDCMISIDKDYSEYICKKLGLKSSKCNGGNS